MNTMDQGVRLGLQEDALDELLAVLGVAYEESEDPRVGRLAEREPLYPQYHRIGHKRQLAYRTLAADRRLVREHYEPAFRALIHDDDPSSPRWLAQVLLTGAGRVRLAEDLVRTVEQGTPYEQGCAVGAWRWAEAPAGMQQRFREACRTVVATCADPWARELLEALTRSGGS
jgi:hypothetical protein